MPPRHRRAEAAAPLAALHGGVVHRRDLRRAGIDEQGVRAEVAAGRWAKAGRHTVIVGTGPVQGEGLLWQAVWESGSGAVLDGAAALLGFGLRGFTPDVIDVSVPVGTRPRRLDGVQVRRRRRMPPVVGGGLPRVRREWATVHAAQWAHSDRAAALLVCLPVQQRLVDPGRLLAVWEATIYSPRRALLDSVIRDVCDGAHSLGELDFARHCRERGLPEPDRQVVRRGPGGRIYLDVEFTEVGLVVEIDGGHHAQALNPVWDALRQNEVTLDRRTVIRIPVLGLRLTPDAFMDQVVRAHELARARAA